MPYIGKQPTVGNFQVCDAISVVDGQAAYTMQVGGSNVEPENANHMLVSLNGILQKPGSSFTISGSTITFASNLATGDVIDFITLLGDTLNTGAPSDDTVTAAKLNNDVISGQTALTAEPDDTDEFLVSDAGTIKRIDYSLIKGGGITMADQWRLTTDNAMSSSGNNDITSNWERNDNSGFGQLGTGMTESSGIFTFPSTGIYLIKIIYDVIGGSQADSAVDVKINTTVNNSDYTQQTATYASMHSNGVYSVGMAEFLFDVTDTSTHKCKFRYYRSTSGTILRLGDT